MRLLFHISDVLSREIRAIVKAAYVRGYSDARSQFEMRWDVESLQKREDMAEQYAGEVEL